MSDIREWPHPRRVRRDLRRRVDRVGMVADGYCPDRFDVIRALVCLAGMAVIMYAPRGH
ncbi:hypothetical protein QFZ63_001955 [Streptomyces sp. B3I7]|nr:hypothetical protein [Streptomyces sp. B3I7]